MERSPRLVARRTGPGGRADLCWVGFAKAAAGSSAAHVLGAESPMGATRFDNRRLVSLHSKLIRSI
jgi:hypothetical protein